MSLRPGKNNHNIKPPRGVGTTGARRAWAPSTF